MPEDAAWTLFDTIMGVGLGGVMALQVWIVQRIIALTTWRASIVTETKMAREASVDKRERIEDDLSKQVDALAKHVTECDVKHSQVLTELGKLNVLMEGFGKGQDELKAEVKNIKADVEELKRRE